MPFKSEKQRKWMWANDPEMAKKWEKEEGSVKEAVGVNVDALLSNPKIQKLLKKWGVKKGQDNVVKLLNYFANNPTHLRKFGFAENVEEAKERNYKEEYKKFQSSTKSKKYRAELNKYNRKKGTYGNGDGKDASHKGGKIVGFEKESVNRGRKEKSRMKKEQKLTEAGVNVWHFYKKANKDKNKFFKMLSDFRKKHSDTKWIKMLNYALKDFNENPKKYKTIDDKQNILFKNLQNNKKVYEGKLTEKSRLKKEGLGSALLPTFKVFIKGYKKPFRVAAMDIKDAMQTARMMIRNSSAKIKKIVKEEKLIEGVFGKFDTGINFRGNGLTVYDRNQSKGGDFKSIAFIANGKVKLYDKDVKKEPKLMKALQNIAKSQLQVEGKLTEDWESPPGYSSKEAKNIVDGALRNYSKDLKKLQYRVIKDWMSKAKSGVIDYFDLVRGFKTGDVSRAHPYEVKFLQSVLEKDKIIERFRKYFGGKKSRR